MLELQCKYKLLCHRPESLVGIESTTIALIAYYTSHKTTRIFLTESGSLISYKNNKNTLGVWVFDARANIAQYIRGFWSVNNYFTLKSVKIQMTLGFYVLKTICPRIQWESLAQNVSLEGEIEIKTKYKKVFLQEFPLGRFLAKNLRVNKIVMLWTLREQVGY